MGSHCLLFAQVIGSAMTNEYSTNHQLITNE